MQGIDFAVFLLSVTAIMEIVGLIINKKKQRPIDKYDKIKGVMSVMYLVGVVLISAL